MDLKSYLFADCSCLTMAEGLLFSGVENNHVVYDVFFRELPDNGGFAVMAGLDLLINELKSLTFEKEDVILMLYYG